jgi:hypothetical protein
VSILQYAFSVGTRVLAVLAVVGASILAAPVAAAGEPQRRPSETTPAPVRPAVGTKLAWRAGRHTQLLWTGFRANSSAGEVLIQTSTEVELAAAPVSTKDGTVFIFKGCRSTRRTDQLPLETQFFASPVTRVSVKQRAGNLEVAVSLRQPVTVVSRKEAGPGGSWFWVLEFPAPADSRPTTAAVTP